MAQSDKRDRHLIVEEASDAETQPTYQDNVGITVSALATRTITVTIKVRDHNEDLEEITPLEFFITSTATGAAGTVTAVDSHSSTTGTEVQEILAEAHYKVLTDTSGDYVVTLTEASTVSSYVAVMYKGRLFMSTILVFT